MKKLIFALLALCLIGTACRDKEPEKQVCNVNNPLTDLPWLDEIVEGFTGDELTHARIYQCTYRDGIGFLLELCVGCPDFGFELTDCEGNLLCILYGHAGDPCSEYCVDFEDKQLIWEINN